jgi:membrane-associated phospholipid phosphatase
MNVDTARLRLLDRSLWTIVAAIAAVVFATDAASDFRLSWISFLVPGAVGAALLAGVRFYESGARDLRLASTLGGTAQVVAFAAVGAPLSYIAASAGFPLQDRLFDAADRAMGFEWRAMLDWMNTFPAAHPLFRVAYDSFPIQASVTVLCLSLSGRLARLRTFVLAFFIATIVTILIAAFVPAEGAWGHYGINPGHHPAISPATHELHLPIFHGLRDGSYRLLLGIGSAGIITFPSLHSAIALIFIFALWPMPLLRWFVVAVNLVMIAATPVDGGHYLIDVIAGLVIAVVCWMAATAYVERVLAGRGVLPIAAAQKSRLAPGE